MIENISEFHLLKLNEQPVENEFSVNLMNNVITKYGETLLVYDIKRKVNFFANKQLNAYLLKVIESNNLLEDKEFYYKNIEFLPIIKFKIKSSTKKDNGMKIVELQFIKDINI